MGRMVKGLALSVIVSSVVMAGGYKIPEQSLELNGIECSLCSTYYMGQIQTITTLQIWLLWMRVKVM